MELIKKETIHEDGSGFLFYVDEQGRKQGEFFKFGFGGRIEMELFYKDDKKEGKGVFYRTNGEPESIVNYKDDKRDGETLRISSLGHPYMRDQYKAGELHGRQETYHGIFNWLKSVKHYEEGVLHGEFIRYHDKDGTIAEKGQYKNGKKDGKWIECMASGKIFKEAEYKDGELVNYKATPIWKL